MSTVCLEHHGRDAALHGSIPKSVRLSDEVLSLEEFTNRVEDHIRVALTKALEIAEREPAAPTLVVWDDLILSEPPPAREEVS